MDQDTQTDQQTLTDFDLPDIPDFPDDFNTDDMNRIWWEMNHRSETRILPTA
ncbi:hypothetical protein ABKY96_005302 [Escherichia coli]